MGFNPRSIKFINENIGKMTHREIADELGTKFSTYMDRVRTLQAKGLVKRLVYSGEPDPQGTIYARKGRRIQYDGLVEEVDVEVTLNQKAKVELVTTDKGRQLTKCGKRKTAVGKFIKEYPTYYLFEKKNGTRECFLKVDIKLEDIKIKYL